MKNQKKSYKVEGLKKMFFEANLENLSVKQKKQIWNNLILKNYRTIKSDTIFNLLGINELVNSIDTTSFITEKDKIKNILLTSEKIVSRNLSYSEIVSENDSLKTIAINELPDLERDIVIIYLNTLNNSALYWLPEDKGGLGNNKLLTTKGWGEAVLADASSIGIGMISVAIVGAISGVGAGALIVVAAEGAANSAFAGVISN